MDNRTQLIIRAAGIVDYCIEQIISGHAVHPVDRALMEWALRDCLDNGIHPDEINALRTTAVT